MEAFITMLQSAATGVSTIFVNVFAAIGSILYDGTAVTTIGWILGIGITGGLVGKLVSLLLAKVKLSK